MIFARSVRAPVRSRAHSLLCWCDFPACIAPAQQQRGPAVWRARPMTRHAWVAVVLCRPHADCVPPSPFLRLSRSFLSVLLLCVVFRLALSLLFPLSPRGPAPGTNSCAGAPGGARGGELPLHHPHLDRLLADAALREILLPAVSAAAVTATPPIWTRRSLCQLCVSFGQLCARFLLRHAV